MKKAIPWLESDDLAPDAVSDAADAQPESEDDSSFWDNMIFPI